MLFTTTTFSEQPIVSCLKGVIRYPWPVYTTLSDDNLLGAASHVLFTRWYSPPQTPDQPTVSCLQGLIRYDNLLGPAYRVLFTRPYSLRQPSRTSLPCPVYKALFATTNFSEQPTMSWLLGFICYHKPLNSLTVSSVLVLFTVTDL